MKKYDLVSIRAIYDPPRISSYRKISIMHNSVEVQEFSSGDASADYKKAVKFAHENASIALLHSSVDQFVDDSNGMYHWSYRDGEFFEMKENKDE